VSEPEDQIRRERGRIRRTAVIGAAVAVAPAIVVAVLRGQSPWHIPYGHVAIPIVILCLLIPGSYILMPLFDGVLILGRARLTGPRAALLVRCLLTDLMGLAALWVFFHLNSVAWFAVLWGLSLPGTWGILRRVRAYERVLERMAAETSSPPTEG